MVAVFVAKAWDQLEGGRVPTRCGLGGTANNRRIVPERADRTEIDKTGRAAKGTVAVDLRAATPVSFSLHFASRRSAKQVWPRELGNLASLASWSWLSS